MPVHGSMHPMPRKRAKKSTSVRLPSALKLGLPLGAHELYSRLRKEKPGDFASLLRDCQAHVRAFEEQFSTNELLPIDDARALAAGLAQLCTRVQAADSKARALAWIAGRYFVIADDGDADFSVVGLDDDIAVFNTICTHLEFHDLLLELG